MGDFVEVIGVARRLGDIDSGGENTDGWSVDGKSSSVGSDIDAEGTAANDCGSGEGEMLGKFLGDGGALGRGSPRADDSDFGLVEASWVAAIEKGLGLKRESGEGFGELFSGEDSNSVFESFLEFGGVKFCESGAFFGGES